ncbi:hypothetical protein [Streptomyces sp. NPDC059639]|uniref:hypothetical protein n=1 Tax=Streptomyces sp. NPDC059639 TaxID=3346891 RepID=UPI003675BE8D
MAVSGAYMASPCTEPVVTAVAEKGLDEAWWTTAVGKLRGIVMFLRLRAAAAVCGGLVLLLASGPSAEAASGAAPVLVTAGGTHSAVLALDPAKQVWDPVRDPASVLWRFDPREVAAYADTQPAKTWVDGPNEAKMRSFKGQDYLLTVAGKGFAGVVKYPGKERYWASDTLTTSADAYAYNPHSIEMVPTPDGSAFDVVVASTGHGSAAPPSDRNVCLFPRSQGPTQTASSCQKLPQAHGLAWDAGRQRLWALGGNQLVAYRVDRTVPATPKLKVDTALSVTVPWGAGHDLNWVPGQDRLWVATGTPVFQYDIGAGQWLGDPAYDGVSGQYPGWETVGTKVTAYGTKAISTDPATGQVVTAQGKVDELTDVAEVHFPEAQHQLKYDGAVWYFYKARWLRAETAG